MKKPIIFLIITIFISLFSNSTVIYSSEKQKPDCDMTCFEWLSGVWVMESNDGMVVETWGKDTNWVYHGKGVTVKTGGDISIETLRLQETTPGLIEYIVLVPHNKEEVSFKLVSATEMKFIFENPSHDFPQRIIYQYKHLLSGDSLITRVEGTVNGKPESIDFGYKRKN